MSLKKILIILIILLILVVGVLVAYNLFIKKPTPSDITSEGELPRGEESITEETGLASRAKVKAISQEPVLSPVIDGQKVKYYLVSNGNVFQSNFDGLNLERISSNILQNLLKVIWSPSKTKVIGIFSSQGNQIKKYLYDYQTQKSTLLNQNIRYINWSPIEDKIAYQYYNSQTEDNNISVAEPDGSQWTNILTTRMKNLIVEWPSPDKVAIRTKPSGLAQSVVYTINLATGDFQKILSETYGLTVLWSPSGDKLLFSETDSQGKNLKLKIADLAEQTTKELNFVTLPEKCAWGQDNRTLFCAVPQSISDLATLPDDYYKGLILFADDFWLINLDTEEKIQIYIPADGETTSYDAKELLLSSQEDYLLFINKKDDLLYSLEL
jgi:hypothetical protein